MLPVDRIRYQRLRDIDTLPAGPVLDRALQLGMTDALLEERRNTGSATAEALRERYGFTEAEIDRLKVRALNEATRRFVVGNLVDPVAAAA